MNEQFKPNHIETGAKREDVWGGVTNPKDHNPRNFRYLVHAINPFAMIYMMDVSLDDRRKGRQVSKQDVDKQATDVLVRPEDVAKKVAISASLIDQDHFATWAESGLILEVTTANVVSAHSQDTYTKNYSREALERLKTTVGIIDPDTLLRGSSTGGGTIGYNEVVVMGTTPQGSEVQLKGFFAKCIDGEFLDKAVASQLESHAARLGLPFIKIEMPNIYAESKIDFFSQQERQYLGINLAGKRYMINLDGKGEHLLSSVDGQLRNFFPSKARFAEVLEFLKSQLTDRPELVEKVRNIYLEADKQRKLPKIEFNEDGSIKNLRFNSGYDGEEKRIFISENYSHQVRLRDEAEGMKLTGSQQEPKRDIYLPVPISDTDRSMEEALPLLNLEINLKVHEFYQKAKLGIVKRFGQSQKRFF